MKKNVNKKPLVSIIMPVYNAGGFLVPAIESILNQTFQDFEFIIVDDASTDSSWNIVRSYQKKYSHKIRAIRLRKNRNNGGDACANEAFSVARGEFIARMDADDIAHPQRLAKQMEYMKSHPKTIVCGTQAHIINKEGFITGEKLEPKTDKDIREKYFVYHPMIHPTVMIRKSLLPKRAFLYKICFNANNDLLTFFELLNYGKFANMSEKLLYYRIHGHNDSLINPKGRFLNTLRIRLFAWKSLGYRPTFSGVLMNIAQTMVVIAMPASVITYMYMSWRGLGKSKTYVTGPYSLRMAPVLSS